MSAYEELESEIIENGLCTYCGACIASCPLNHLRWMYGRPRRPEKKAVCKDCEVCYRTCYMTGFERGEIEERIFGREIKEEVIGIYRHVFSARVNNGIILEKALDGGIVTAILTYALNEKMIDGAVLTDKDGWMPKPSVARSFDDFLGAAGTRYGISPILMNIRTAVIDHELDRICIVGTPCHVQSIRHLQQINFELHPAITLVLGLFCRENFEYEMICKRLEDEGVKITEIKKIDITDDHFNVYTRDKISLPITETKKWVPKHCLVCDDYTNELADISVGSDGSEDGWSTVIVRTEIGEKIVAGLKNSGYISIKPIGDFNSVKEASVRKRTKAAVRRRVSKGDSSEIGCITGTSIAKA